MSGAARVLCGGASYSQYFCFFCRYFCFWGLSPRPVWEGSFRSLGPRFSGDARANVPFCMCEIN